MIINDEIIQLMMLKMIVKREMHLQDEDILSVQSGTLACEEFVKQHFDLVIVDLCMPIMNGFETAVNIRRLAVGYEPFILAVSANIDPITV